MATCKDCLHFEVCDSGRHIGEYEIDDGVYSDGVENQCLAFKNKADFVEVKHGEWVKAQFVQRSGFRTVRDYICSICGKVYAIEQPCNLMNYCPYCGAKMDGRRDT